MSPFGYSHPHAIYFTGKARENRVWSATDNPSAIHSIMRSLVLLVAVAQLAATSMGFFLPGMAPTTVLRGVTAPSTVQVRNCWV